MLPYASRPVHSCTFTNQQAIKNHPDKNPDDPTAAERFKDIAIAYTTLSDEGLRHSYNEFGKGKGDGANEEGMVDPESIFSQLFGGERFQVSVSAPKEVLSVEPRR